MGYIYTQMSFLAPLAGGLFMNMLGGFRAGGRVPKTGPYLLHQNEVVIPSHVVSQYAKRKPAPPPRPRRRVKARRPARKGRKKK